VPALVLFGRVCLLLADAWGGLAAAASLPAGQQPRFVFCGDLGSGCRDVAAWLQVYSPQLVTTGYPLQSLQEGVTALSAAADVAMQSLAFDAHAGRMYSAVSVGLVGELVQRMRVVGEALGAVPVPDFCNNSSCVNVCGPSEVLLVSGRSCICAGCRTARYCGRVCQRQAWKQHKPACKALAAAAAAAACAHAAEGGDAA
jgi:hypothetical protein